MLRLHKIINIKHNKLIIIIIWFLLIHKDEKVHLLAWLGQISRNYDIDISVKAFITFLHMALIFLIPKRILWELEVFDILKINIVNSMVAFQQEDFVVLAN